MADVQSITSAVVQVGKYGGRGFIVAAGDSRYIVTAAHCVGKLPEPQPARNTSDVTYRHFIGPLGGKRLVSAECLFMDPIADLAVFGSPDTQNLYEQAIAYGC
jgi:S1-C subfamily serine protease